ncbi:MAG TPA: outer membrane beta-barrel protein [Acetobacteraceae bacterium]|nr:outer membrane beta-barrel protein [Acetobacteraceae bacterium]
MPPRLLRLLAALALLLPGAARAQEDRLSGLYINAFFGLAVLDSTVTVPGTGGAPPMRFVDQGGDGMIYGLRLGYGHRFSEGLYLGAEIEGLLPISVTSRLMAAGVEYRARLRQEIGAYGRVGYSLDGRSLLFFRAGLTVPHQVFETGAEAQSRRTPGLALGAGAEVLVLPRVGIRLDGTWDLPAGRNDLESYRATLAVVWRF